MKLNVGCGKDIREGADWLNLDSVALPGVDIVHDLETCATDRIPQPDDSIEEFLLAHIIEHIRNVLPMMQELHRVAVPGAKMLIRCPYGSSDDAFEDPTHVRPYFLNSFGYFSQPFYWRVSAKEVSGVDCSDVPGRYTAASGEVWINGYGYRGDWQPETVTLICRTEPCKGLSPQQVLEKVNRERNVVTEMLVELRAIKPIREAKKDLQVAPKLRIGV